MISPDFSESICTSQALNAWASLGAFFDDGSMARTSSPPISFGLKPNSSSTPKMSSVASRAVVAVIRQAPVSEISVRSFHSSSSSFFTIRHGMPGCRRQPAAAASARISEFLTR